MFKDTLKIAGMLAILVFLPLNTTQASDRMNLNPYNELAVSGLESAAELLDSGQIMVKRGEPYDESKDPALHKSTPPEEGPLHGFFPVSVLFLLAAGIFVYFIKTD